MHVPMDNGNKGSFGELVNSFEKLPHSNIGDWSSIEALGVSIIGFLKLKTTKIAFVAE